uniref:CitMHS domain-containing protein n=1 Tax=Rhabditophanes sp. KR3021 TaxID=114890 RepID=A0AC35U6Q4_9BILA
MRRMSNPNDSSMNLLGTINPASKTSIATTVEELGVFEGTSCTNMIERDDGKVINKTSYYKYYQYLIGVCKFKKVVSLIGAPLIFAPLFFSSEPQLRCLFCVIIMGIYWAVGPIPLAATAMLPVVLFPILGISTAKDVGSKYVNDTNFLFIGGLITAAAVEKSGLHERIALKVLTFVGSRPIKIMGGFMLVTAILSMFISNTATTAMMVPIVQSVIAQLESSFDEEEASSKSEDTEASKKSKSNQKSKMAAGFYLSIAFAANIGGVGTLTGTPPNLVLIGQMQQLFNNAITGVNYVTWMFYAIPLMLLCLLCAWFILCLMFLDIKKKGSEIVSGMINSRYQNLPPFQFSEGVVSFLFLTLVLLWIGRDPQIIPGFGALFGNSYFTDATSAMIISLLLFIIPTQKPSWTRVKAILRGQDVAKIDRLMDWETMQSHFPWSIVFLLGGGFALASGVQSSGLSKSIGNVLVSFNHLPVVYLQLFCLGFCMLVTNICSNTVTASIFIPIVANIAISIHANPLTLMLPTTIACSFSFVLPAGTPPNAIVFARGAVSVPQMVLSGLAISVTTIIITTVHLQTLALTVFDLNDFPDWANIHNTTTPSTTV